MGATPVDRVNGLARAPRCQAGAGSLSRPMTDEIICERRGAAGHVLLNRPAALNALTHGMVKGLAAALDRWEADPAVTRIVVEGAGGKAFCAGGDIRMLYEAGRAGRHAEALAFWRQANNWRDWPADDVAETAAKAGGY